MDVKPVTLTGRVVRLEPLSEAHVPNLAAVAQDDSLWAYIPYPPVHSEADMLAQVRDLLARLGDRDLESVALWRMEGYRNDEIADKLGCTPRTVERKLRIIRGLWEKEITS